MLAGSDPVLGGNVFSWVIVSDSQHCRQNKIAYIPSNSYETLIDSIFRTLTGPLFPVYFRRLIVEEISNQYAQSKTKCILTAGSAEPGGARGALAPPPQ